MSVVKNLVFVYGTLKRGGPNYDRLLGENCAGDAKFCSEAITADWYAIWVALAAERILRQRWSISGLSPLCGFPLFCCIK